MKKILCVLLVGVLLIGLAACGKAPTNTESGNNTNTSSQSSSSSSSDTQPKTYSVYIPNDNANGFVVETIQVEEISAENILSELINQNVLPETVSINSFNVDAGLITIDFNQAFADLVCSMGSSGELMIVGSVVNTFLDAFQAEYVYFTVNGQVLESGHITYDFNLSFVTVDHESEN